MFKHNSVLTRRNVHANAAIADVVFCVNSIYGNHRSSPRDDDKQCLKLITPEQELAKNVATQDRQIA